MINVWTGGLLTESRLHTTAPVKSHTTLSRPYEYNIKVKSLSMYYRDINDVYIQLVAAVIKRQSGHSFSNAGTREFVTYYLWFLIKRTRSRHA